MTSQLVDIHTPGLKWWLKHLETDFDPVHSVDLFINALKRQTVQDPLPAAVATAQLFLRLIAAHKFTNIHNLVEYVVSLETRLSSARPRELSVRNMVRRVLGIVREEAENQGLGEQYKQSMEALQAAEDSNFKGASTPNSEHHRPAPLRTRTSFAVVPPKVNDLFNILSHPSTPSHSGASTPHSATPHHISAPPPPPANIPYKDIRPSIIQDIQELLEELESTETSISDSALSVIHKNEVIMTYGLPASIHHLLLRASQKRNHDFTLVVVEGSSNILKHSHAAAAKTPPTSIAAVTNDDDQKLKSLQENGVQLILISDSNINNFIGRVNKVLIEARYVLADGTVLANSGASNVALAAQALRKPVVVVAGSHTLSPVTCFDKGDLVDIGEPCTVEFTDEWVLENVELPNPLTDWIEPALVTMFVTHTGLVARNSINKVTLDLYHMPEADLL